MQLNGWQKLGVALSIAWAIGAGISTNNEDVERAENFAKLAYKTCSNTKMLAKESDLTQCKKEKAAAETGEDGKDDGMFGRSARAKLMANPRIAAYF